MKPSDIYKASHWVTAIAPKDAEDYRSRKNPGNANRRKATRNTYEFHKKNQPNHNIGWVSSLDEPLAVVDLDPPKERKEALKGSSKAEMLRYLSDEFVPSLPEKFQRLVANNYTEISVSGLGLRCFMIADFDKSQYSKYVKTKEFEGQVNLHGDMFMICTQEVYTDGPILKMSKGFLHEHFKVRVGEQLEDSTSSLESSNTTLTIEERQQLLGQDLYTRVLRLPIDQNEKIKKVWHDLTGSEYQHYDYWMHIAMALHDVGTLTYTESEAFEAFHAWSMQDEDGYVSEDDCLQTWNACPYREGGISHKTLIELLNRLEFAWPHPVIGKTGKVTSRPKVGRFENWKYLINYFGIQIYKDSAYRFFLTAADTQTLDAYFNITDSSMVINGKTLGQYYGPFSDEELYSRMFTFAQNHGYDDKLGRHKVKELMDAYIHTSGCQRFNVMYKWLATPYDELPRELKHEGVRGGATDVSVYNNQSTLDYITSCITPSVRMPGKEQGCKIAIRLFFMGMAKLLSSVHAPMRFDENAGLLLLIGPEGVYKTSFFKSLLPHVLNEYCVLTVQGLTKNVGSKAMRDVYRYMANSGFVIFDEFDSLPKEFLQAEMKKLISGNSVEFTEIYQKTAVKLPRAAAIGGTTNSDKIIMSDYGNRRIWPLMVQNIDTSALCKVNWHKLYNDLIMEFEAEINKGKTPWLPTKEELDVLKKVQHKITSTTGFELVLKEIFPDNEQFPGLGYVTNIQTKSPFLMSTKEVIAVLAASGEQVNRRDRKALENALKRFCGKWTGTDGKELEMPNVRAIIKSGQLEQGVHKRWFIPPAATAPFGDME